MKFHGTVLEFIVFDDSDAADFLPMKKRNDGTWEYDPAYALTPEASGIMYEEFRPDNSYVSMKDVADFIRVKPPTRYRSGATPFEEPGSGLVPKSRIP